MEVDGIVASRKHERLVKYKVENWCLQDTHVAYTYKLATRFLHEE